MGQTEVDAARAAYVALHDTEQRWRHGSGLFTLYVLRRQQQTALDAAVAALSGPELQALREELN